MPIPKNLKKKLEQAIKSQERRLAKNNYYVLEMDEERPVFEDKSLVVVLTPYEKKVA